MEQMEIKTAYVDLQELMKQYLDQERFHGYCRKCPKYMQLWSCPPFDQPAEEYLENYTGIYVIATKLPISEELREEMFLPESQQEAAEEIMVEAREKLEKMLLRLEQSTEGSRAMTAGSCRLCSRCEKPLGMPCRQPGKMRYSLEALGFDVTAISAEILDIPIKWIEKQLPEHLTLVHGFLIKKAPGEEIPSLTVTEDGDAFELSRSDR